MNEHELKPCPFCGDEAPVLQRQFSMKVNSYFVFVKCENCRGQSAPFFDHHVEDVNNDWRTPACLRAVKNWNRRANDGGCEMD